MIRKYDTNKIILSYKETHDKWTIINIKDIKNPFTINFSNNSNFIKNYTNHNLKDDYDYFKNNKQYSVSTNAGSGYGGNNLLSDNKFNTKSVVGFSYEQLTYLKYNNIYAIEILPHGKYRTLNVIQI